MRSLGHSLHDFLRRHSISSTALFDANAKFRLGLLTTLQNDLLQIDPLIHLKAGVGFPPGVLGPFQNLIQSRNTLSELMKDIVRYSSLLSPYASYDIMASETHIRLTKIVHVPRECISTHSALLCFSTILAMTRALSGVRWVPHRIQLTCKDFLVAGHFGKLAGAQVDIGCDRDEIIFSKDILKLPLLSADPAMAGMMEDYILERLAGSFDSIGLREKIEHLIGKQLLEGSPDVQLTASQTGMSVRSLQRALSAQGISFSELVNEYRKKKAVHLLRHSTLPLKQISSQLGYAHLSAFNRAFRVWYRTSPGAFLSRRSSSSDVV
jgi:AraC-like DNA-binding protein